MLVKMGWNIKMKEVDSMYIIKFEGKCDFLLETMSLENIQNPKIISAVLSSSSGSFFCEIRSNYSNEGETIYYCSEYLQNLISIILYETGYRVRKIEWKFLQSDEGTETNPNTKTLVFRDSIEIRSEITVIKPIELPLVLKSKLENNQSYVTSGYKSLFVEITKIDDVIAKFILFYSILTALKGKQRFVDNFIKTIEPNVEMRPTTLKNANYYETIYSFLRNQIGHTQETTDTEELHREVSSKLNGIREIVKIAIEEN